MTPLDPEAAVEAARVELQGHRYALRRAILGLMRVGDEFLEATPPGDDVPVPTSGLARRAKALADRAELYEAASTAYARAVAAYNVHRLEGS